jgi:RNA-directed DNA polymerase
VIQPRKKEMGGRRGLLIGRHYDDLASQRSSLPGVQEHGTFAVGFPRNLRDLCVSSSNNGRAPRRWRQATERCTSRPSERTAGATEVARSEGNEVKRDEHAGVGVAHRTDEVGEPLSAGLDGGMGRPSYRPKKGQITETLCSGNVTTKLQRIAELARTDRQRALTSVAHVIDVEWVREAFRRTRKDGAAGVDGKSATEFTNDLESNLRLLASQLRAGTYRPPPVRRVHIPKGNGKTRPIGVPTFEDKVAQRAVAMVLEAIYETEFLDNSYGFRPGRSAHQALEELQRRPTYWKKCWVIEADIEGFFDSIDHGALRSVLDRRIRDGVIRRLIDRWLQAGVMESGRLTVPDEGTPQGGVISPLLANIFLHDVLDLWVEHSVRPRLSGKSKLIRYADDFVLLVHNGEDVPRVMSALAKRFERFGLRLHPDKTRALSFNSPGRGKPRAQTARSFDFLGFTHYWASSRNGNWVVKQRTAKDRFSRASKAAKERCRRLRHMPLASQHRALCLLLRGHYGYYGITGNGDALARFRNEVTRHWGRALARRNGKRFVWVRFTATLTRFPLPMPRPPRSVLPSEPVA